MPLFTTTRNLFASSIGAYKTLPSISDGAFGENICRLKVVYDFHKKISISDA